MRYHTADVTEVDLRMYVRDYLREGVREEVSFRDAPALKINKHDGNEITRLHPQLSIP